MALRKKTKAASSRKKAPDEVSCRGCGELMHTAEDLAGNPALSKVDVCKNCKGKAKNG